MKNLKVYEEYDIDVEGDIGEEYVKAIVSHYVDHITDGGTLQDSFDFYCKEDLDEELRHIVVSETRSFINRMQNQINNLTFTDDDYIERDAKKYNV